MKKLLFLGAWAFGVLALLQPSARAADEAAIKRAIDAGVNNLKKSQSEDGTFGGGRHEWALGATSLGALTLLECDVAPDDESIKKAAEYVRTGAVSATKTYNISVAILFLDKLRDPVDVALIESLTVRLMAGQTASGSWGYDCPAISEKETKRLTDLLKGRTELKAGRTLPKGDEAKRSGNDVAKEIKDQLRNGVGGGNAPAGPAAPGAGLGSSAGDNSNTQFALLALWVARRQGMPVELALGRVSQHFRATAVKDDRVWGYSAGGGGLGGGSDNGGSMVCAGILGLAVAYGVSTEMAEEKAKPKEDGTKDFKVADISLDPLVVSALTALFKSVGKPVGKNNAGAANIPKLGTSSYYFMWSLERVCVGLDIETFAGKNWYDWGSEVLLANQQGDGSWIADYSGYKADTCFALLFLKKANFARDLSAKLRGKLDKRALRGHVGGIDLKDKTDSPTSPKENDDKPSGTKETAKPPVEGKDVERLTRAVVDAKGELQGKMLTDFHSDKDRKYTEALLNAISQLGADAKKGVRKVLAERLANEGEAKPDKLNDYLGDRDSEIRRAAALACAINKSKQHVPQLISLLRDREDLVSRAAWAALKHMTGQDFGPAADATDGEKDRAVEAWTDWWKKNGK